ncbi:2'-5' RNA ligase [Paenibacillus pectinilyticus]|uniref:RNA 2',3'-cyclic phosphodiesterase n=1 Tax=Paenibacillus pectinilyticus TaxID=512399 RepID=A0A1C1A1F5_9BACL|nr:RNA 2',3'-cyclic phosphodiesterase [Paenibacillus pectinilyticus]OCT14353.1 2'-5' RNA ligase [Paenibacillus pectinilyticus]
MNQVNLVRLFVAVPVPPGIKHAFASWIDQIKPHLSFRKWVHPGDLHITLQFLGDTPSGSVLRINQVLHEIMTVTSPLSLRVEPLGFFGRSTQPSVLWAGVGGDVEALRNLQKRVAEALTPLGFSIEDRNFHPHLTLARNYISKTSFDRNKLSTLTMLNSSPEDLLSWKSNEVMLYRSHLNKRPMYEAITFDDLKSE